MVIEPYFSIFLIVIGTYGLFIVVNTPVIRIKQNDGRCRKGICRILNPATVKPDLRDLACNRNTHGDKVSVGVAGQLFFYKSYIIVDLATGFLVNDLDHEPCKFRVKLNSGSLYKGFSGNEVRLCVTISLLGGHGNKGVSHSNDPGYFRYIIAF